jgi:hypothetical protein
LLPVKSNDETSEPSRGGAGGVEWKEARMPNDDEDWPSRSRGSAKGAVSATSAGPGSRDCGKGKNLESVEGLVEWRKRGQMRKVGKQERNSLFLPSCVVPIAPWTSRKASAPYSIIQSFHERRDSKSMSRRLNFRARMTNDESHPGTPPPGMRSISPLSLTAASTYPERLAPKCVTKQSFVTRPEYRMTTGLTFVPLVP